MLVCINAFQTTQHDSQVQIGELRKDDRRYGKVQRKVSLPDMRKKVSILLSSWETSGGNGGEVSEDWI